MLSEALDESATMATLERISSVYGARLPSPAPSRGRVIDRLRSCMGYGLAIALADYAAPDSCLVLRKAPSGQPYTVSSASPLLLPRFPTISHDGPAVMCALSSCHSVVGIGIDVVQVARVPPQQLVIGPAFSSYLAPREVEQLAAMCAVRAKESFACMWASKEAMFKVC
jgi:phosphopantetheinyl transferase